MTMAAVVPLALLALLPPVAADELGPPAPAGDDAGGFHGFGSFDTHSQAQIVTLTGFLNAFREDNSVVGTLSEIPPLNTEQAMTEVSEGVDDLAAVPDKRTTTVAMDFGRVTVDDSMILYLFGTPGQTRFWFMWDELASGAVGAVVLVDLRRIDDCFAAVDYFEASDMGDEILRLQARLAPERPTHPLEDRRSLMPVRVAGWSSASSTRAGAAMGAPPRSASRRPGGRSTPGRRRRRAPARACS